ncbi:MAG: prepilin-type N-terminal cleavage/methylation domain-containing protein, partial [Lentisphaerae bacterium]|nr:prepilin-type N-terminal cleavage/methylation domain-containing protein [Lentisphaerota bacterium]
MRDGSRRGLTLVEMLTVLFVVSILVAFVTGTARYASRAAETRRAQADLHLLADAL